jgi:hypothetical protein
MEKLQSGLKVTLWKEGTTYNSILEKEDNKMLQGSEEEITVTVTPLVMNKKKGRSCKSQLVQPAERRFTRSCLAEGYKPKPVLSVQPKIKKKSRAKLLIQKEEDEEEEISQATEE